jgi:hypothetical protein
MKPAESLFMSTDNTKLILLYSVQRMGGDMGQSIGGQTVAEENVFKFKPVKFCSVLFQCVYEKHSFFFSPLILKSYNILIVILHCHVSDCLK